MKPFPDFLVVGAARSGTTALYEYLGAHDDIFLPKVKEPCFFCFADGKPDYKHGRFSFAVTEEQAYLKLFENARPGHIKGEMSTPYLYLYERTIANILRLVPDADAVKIVIMLRNPFERAHSQYLWRRRDGRENLGFYEALMAEESRKTEGYSFDYFYASRSLYADAVAAYMEAFKKVHVIWYDDFLAERNAELQKLCEFLGVAFDEKITAGDKRNASSTPRSAWLARVMTSESRLKFKVLNSLPRRMRSRLVETFRLLNASKEQPVEMDDRSRKYLNDYFSDDIKKLEKLTGRDLMIWRQF